jgi:hypothetical protein
MEPEKEAEKDSRHNRRRGLEIADGMSDTPPQTPDGTQQREALSGENQHFFLEQENQGLRLRALRCAARRVGKNSFAAHRCSAQAEAEEARAREEAMGHNGKTIDRAHFGLIDR